MKKSLLLAAVAAFALAGAAQATPIMPSFVGAPTGWSVDRYAPTSFADIGTYQGRSDVLGIGIGSAGNSANRGGQSGSFYNTQGMSYAITGGAGDSLSASLYVSHDWAHADMGARRTDMWGVTTDNSANVAGYPIIGFTNEGDNGFVGFRTWDDTAGVWHDLANAVAYNAWNDLDILFTGTAYEYFINGTLADTITADVGAQNFSKVIMQAYNFADPIAWSGAVANDYVAHWSNTKNVPEPGSFALAGIGLAGLVTIRRRKASNKA